MVAESTIDTGTQCLGSGTQMFVVGVAHRAVTTSDPREHDPLVSDRHPSSGGADGHNLPGDFMA